MKKALLPIFLLVAFFAKGQTVNSLPVTLVEFKADMSGNEMQISWTSLQEINIHSYIIEKSTNGVNWSSVTSVTAKGATNIPKDYVCQDAAPATINYYRLRVVDFNNNSTYSDIIVKKVKTISPNISVYPNPAVNTVNIIADQDMAAKAITVYVLNQSGQQISTSGTSSFSNMVSINTGSLKAGAYMLDIRLANGKTEIRPLIIAR